MMTFVLKKTKIKQKIQTSFNCNCKIKILRPAEYKSQIRPLCGLLYPYVHPSQSVRSQHTHTHTEHAIPDVRQLFADAQPRSLFCCRCFAERFPPASNRCGPSRRQRRLNISAKSHQPSAAAKMIRSTHEVSRGMKCGKKFICAQNVLII